MFEARKLKSWKFLYFQQLYPKYFLKDVCFKVNFGILYPNIRLCFNIIQVYNILPLNIRQVNWNYFGHHAFFNTTSCYIAYYILA